MDEFPSLESIMRRNVELKTLTEECDKLTGVTIDSDNPLWAMRSMRVPMNTPEDKIIMDKLKKY